MCILCPADLLQIWRCKALLGPSGSVWAAQPVEHVSFSIRAKLEDLKGLSTHNLLIQNTLIYSLPKPLQEDNLARSCVSLKKSISIGSMCTSY